MSILLAFAIVQETIALPAVPEYTPTWNARLAPLLAWDHHDAIAATAKTPYVIRVGNSAVAGVHHTLDPKDAQFQRLEELWKQIDPTVVLVEGRPGPLVGRRSDVIRRLGEPGWAMLLAHSENKKIFSWEPTRAAELEAIRRAGSIENAATFLFLRTYQSNRRGGPLDDAKAEALLKRRLVQYRLGEVFPNLAAFDAFWQRTQANLGDWRTLSEEAIGRRSGTVFGKIGFEVGEVRTANLARCLLDLSSKGERVLAICGSGHAIRVAPCLSEK